MPKKTQNKRFNRRKSTNKKDKATEKVKPTCTGDELNNDVHQEQSTSVATSSNMIKVLQDICVMPAMESSHIPQKDKLDKGKRRVSYVSTKVASSDSEDDNIPSKLFNINQERLKRSVAEGRSDVSHLSQDREVILRMRAIYPNNIDLDAAGPYIPSPDIVEVAELARTLKRKHSSDSDATVSPKQIVVEAMVHRTVFDQTAGVHKAPIVDPSTSNNIHCGTTATSNLDKVMDMNDIREEMNVMVGHTPVNMVHDDNNLIRPIEDHEIVAPVVRPIDEAERRREIMTEVQRLRNERPHVPTYLAAAEMPPDIREDELGPFNHICPHCTAMHFAVEKNTRRVYTKCCHDGKVSLERLGAMPYLLRELFEGRHPLSNIFKRFVLKYNYAFQFVSLQANLRDLPPGRAPPVYVIQGKVHHHVSDIEVNAPIQRYGPLYFLDPEAADQQRAANNQGQLNVGLLAQIRNELRQVNPYVLAYRWAREEYDREVERIRLLREEAERNNVENPPLRMPEVTLQLLEVRGARQYDAPLAEEVSAVFSIAPNAPDRPGIRLFAREGPIRVMELRDDSEILDPLVYPLLFPRGERGWYPGIRQTQGNRRVTLCQYAAYRLAIRDNETRFTYGGKLTQQYIVDYGYRMTRNDLRFIERNQEALRVAEYRGLADYLHRRLEDDGQGGDEEDLHVRAISRMIILPSTYVGSPRYLQQLFQDAMAMVAKFGVPSVFLTLTTNTNWSEIKNNIPRGHCASDHASLVDRVFKCKLDRVMIELLEQHVFGVPLANIHVIEFQKRGLPHCHDVLFLNREDRLIDAVRIDALISAEIPDPETDPELYDIVTNLHIHGPCGVYSPNANCMREGKCIKHFPKIFCDQTMIKENGYVQYRRLDNGRHIIKRVNGRECRLDNRWVVPYNPYMLRKYRCHMNIEACSTAQCIKYLFKYMFKGVDMALLRIHRAGQDYNEVEQFLNGRYLSPPEAAWHINQFPMHKSSHTVIRLPVHLPQEQGVVFRVGDEEQAIEQNRTTMLMAWFELNETDPEARRYLYIEIPEHYVWLAGQRRWRQRQRGGDKIVVRMYNVSVRRQELFYLRLLLLYVRGARSFQDVRTVEGVVYETFKEACRARRLLADDTEWSRTLREACARDMPRQLRSMFAYMLIYCDMNDSPALWQEFRHHFIQDFIRHGLTEEEATQRTLQHIQAILLINGTRLSNYRLPEPDQDVEAAIDAVDTQAERHEAVALRANLNEEQRIVYDAVMTALDADDNDAGQRLFLVDAPAGCGKTYLFRSLISTVLGRDQTVAVMAPTGIAASILKGGRTIHSLFQLPLDINETTTSSVRASTGNGEKLALASLIVIDEISMVTTLIFDIIEFTLRDVCSDRRPFGNKVVLIGGDFRQTLPIVAGGDRCAMISACIKSNRHWHLFRNFPLRTNVRAAENQAFSEWLLQLGNDTLPIFRRTPYGNIVQIPLECQVNDLDSLIDFCFQDTDPSVAINRAILTPTNALCDQINDLILDKLPGVPMVYHSADSVDLTDDENVEAANYPIELLNTLAPSGVPQHQLALKVGAIVMLMRNLNVRKGLCNGTRLIVRLLAENYVDAEKVDSNGAPTGERVFIPRIDVKTNAGVLPFKFKRRQFPLRLAYSITVHKSQGQTFQRVGIYLEQPMFAHGQLYVSFSRARNLEDVRILLKQSSQQGRLLPNNHNIYTRNIVYREDAAQRYKPKKRKLTFIVYPTTYSHNPGISCTATWIIVVLFSFNLRYAEEISMVHQFYVCIIFR